MKHHDDGEQLAVVGSSPGAIGVANFEGCQEDECAALGLLICNLTEG